MPPKFLAKLKSGASSGWKKTSSTVGGWFSGRPKIGQKGLSRQAKSKIGEVLKAREARTENVKFGGSVGATAGFFAGGEEMPINVGMRTLRGAVTGAGSGFVLGSKEVGQKTRGTIEAIAREARRRPGVWRDLRNYKYIYYDMQGRPTFSNISNWVAFAGRKRISTQEIRDAMAGLRGAGGPRRPGGKTPPKPAPKGAGKPPARPPAKPAPKPPIRPTPKPPLRPTPKTPAKPIVKPKPPPITPRAGKPPVVKPGAKTPGTPGKASPPKPPMPAGGKATPPKIQPGGKRTGPTPAGGSASFTKLKRLRGRIVAESRAGKTPVVPGKRGKSGEDIEIKVKEKVTRTRTVSMRKRKAPTGPEKLPTELL